MFKTVKVGDTSLQYTIVSQHDEPTPCPPPAFVYNKSKLSKRRNRYRKTVILILITLIMGCGIVIAAVLVPILVASKLVGSLPESAKFQTFAVAASSLQGYGKHDQNGHKYVELLPIKAAPSLSTSVDTIIEFQDEIPVLARNPKVWSLRRPNTESIGRSSPSVTSAASATTVKMSVITNTKDNDQALITNSKRATVYYATNNTDNVTPLPQSDNELLTTTQTISYWQTFAPRPVGNIITLMVSEF